MNKADTLKNGIQTLPPAYFALVMATGILSIAAHLQHFETASNLLFRINIIAFFVLLLLYAGRILFFFPSFTRDLVSHAKGAGFLTLVAGSCILGTEYAQGKGNYGPATVLWLFALAVWLLILYPFLAGTVLKTQKPSPEEGLSGAWLLTVVSTQSLSILAGVLASHRAPYSDTLLFCSLAFFSLGVVLYLVLISLITYRLLFYPLKPEEITPSYWIDMGAAAITTLAGVLLSQEVKDSLLLVGYSSFISAMALLFWTVATFWIPFIVILEIWRYVIKKSPLKYEPDYWSLVFPLGMYTVCTAHLSEVLVLPFLHGVAKVFIYVAAAAWLTVFLGLILQLVQFFGKSTEKEEPKSIRST